MIGIGDTFNYQCELKLKKPGPFKAEIVIFLEDNGIREVTITVQGVAVAPEADTRAKPPTP